MNYQNILLELQKYYANLLIIQYNGLPKATATIKMLVALICANMILLQIQNGFDWKTAVGQQLDFIGKWVGVDRYITVGLYDNHNWFSLIEITGATSQFQGGFAEISNFDTNPGGFLTPELGSSQLANLSDENFRFLIGLKIIKNSIAHTCKSIDDAIYEYSNGEIYTTWDLTNRVLTYNYPTVSGGIMEVALVKGVLPCPPTCSVTIRGIEE